VRAHILIVEDDPGMASFTKLLLTDNGYKAHVAGTAEGALSYIQKNLPDLIVTDIQLPGLSGIKLCEVIKGEPRTAALPIIMLTVLGSELDKVKGLRIGADDYLVKPFSSEEFLARVEALLRRVQRGGVPVETFKVNDLVVDVKRHEVLIKGQPVVLREMEFQLLVLLLQNQGLLVDREFLTKSLWKDQAIVTENTLSVHMMNLRKKLGPYEKCIETIIGKGYKFTNPY